MKKKLSVVTVVCVPSFVSFPPLFTNQSYRRRLLPLMKCHLSPSSLTFPTLDVQLTDGDVD